MRKLFMLILAAMLLLAAYQKYQSSEEATPIALQATLTPTVLPSPTVISTPSVSFGALPFTVSLVPELIEVDIKLVSVYGENAPRSGNVYQVPASAIGCSPSPKEVAMEVFRLSDLNNVPRKVYGALILSESSMIQMIERNGQCVLIQNFDGAPAYCAAQIYAPAGSGYSRIVHPEYNLSDLHNLTTCLNAGIEVLLGMPGDWDEKVAHYKGIVADDFYSHSDWMAFKRLQNDGGFLTSDGEWISWE